MGRNDDAWTGPLKRRDEYLWEIPADYKPGMRVPGLIVAGERLLDTIRRDRAPEQVANVACLPGIVKYSLAMPDIHWGYGFPIGGVAATAVEEGGVVSPGGVGYDINCGVRLLRSKLHREEVEDRKKELAALLFSRVPCGVGSTGKLRLSKDDQRRVLIDGAAWAVKNGLGSEDDLRRTENEGRLDGADPSAVSQKALARGRDQVGTLGSGNHFLEVQYVEKVFDEEAAAAFGLEEGTVTVMIHSGSRGLGHQVCDDAIRRFRNLDAFDLPDKQLCCAPVDSPEGRAYLAAMACAANYAWANRQVLMHLVIEAFEAFFRAGREHLGLQLVYDVAHNIAKIERHDVDGRTIRLCVHRKGATRAFPPGHRELPDEYRHIGQPVIIPGDMGSASYVLRGTPKAMEITFGSTCHGAGRLMSRHEAIRQAKGRSIQREMERMGIFVMARGKSTLAEEAGFAYKDVDDVVEAVDGLGISTRVARLRPMVVVKG